MSVRVCDGECDKVVELPAYRGKRDLPSCLARLPDLKLPHTLHPV